MDFGRWTIFPENLGDFGETMDEFTKTWTIFGETWMANFKIVKHGLHFGPCL